MNPTAPEPATFRRRTSSRTPPRIALRLASLIGGMSSNHLAGQRLADNGDVIVRVLEFAYRCIVVLIADQQGNAFLRERSRMGQQEGLQENDRTKHHRIPLPIPFVFYAPDPWSHRLAFPGHGSRCNASKDWVTQITQKSSNDAGKPWQERSRSIGSLKMIDVWPPAH